MEAFGKMASSQYIQIPLTAWFIAQLLKVLIVLVQSKKIDFRKFVSAGGMPSSHSALVCSITVLIGEKAGYDTLIFSLSLIMALIVMYDAAGVRRAAGKQAKILNIIVKEMESKDLNMDERLKELLGHTPVEVFAGAVLGMMITLLCIY